MKRSDFVVTCASAAATASVGLRPGYALAQAQIAASIAESVATNLAKTAVSKGFDAVGMGSVWNFLNGGGSSDHSAEILAKLDQISAQLTGISTQVADLQNDVDKDFAQGDFDTVVLPVGALISANDTLKADYRALLSGDANGEDISGILGQTMTDLKKIDGGPAIWHNALIGNPGTSVIVAANRLASNYNAEFYTQDSAERFQNLWDLFDAQQAMTVFYYVELLSATNQRGRVVDTIRTYLQNRRQQLQLLRGQQRDVTEVMTLSISGTPRMLHGKFTGPALPPLTIVARKPPYMMWSLQLLGPTTQGNATYELFCSAYGDVVRFQNQTKDPVSIAFDNANETMIDGRYFRRPDGSEFEALVTAAGGTYDGDPGGQFVTELGKLGFVFPPDVTSIWTIHTSGESDPYLGITPGSKFECHSSSTTDDIRRSGKYFSGNNLYRQNDKPEHPCGDPNAEGLSIYCGITQGQYFYSK